MTLRFHFAKEEAEGGFISRPVIPIILKHSTKIILTEGLIDSGSDCTFLPFDVAEDLELELSKEKHRTVGLEGETYCYSSKCQLTRQARA